MAAASACGRRRAPSISSTPSAASGSPTDPIHPQREATLSTHPDTPVPSLRDAVRRYTDLPADDVAWLHRLVGEWQLLADLSFADLLLWVRGTEGELVAVAQIRPVTAQTAFVEDKVGTLAPAARRPLLDRAWSQGRVSRDGDPELTFGVPVREEAFPVRHGDRVIGVVGRHTNLAAARTPSRLELTYLQAATALAQMVAEGRFPFEDEPVADPDASPRAGDGLIRLDTDGDVIYASPNAVSAYRRLGLTGDVVGVHLGDMTAALAPVTEPVEEALSTSLAGRMPREVEVEAGAIVRLRVIPLLAGGVREGALVLLRDITELRHRDRELLTKDATIREIHHRVKNNLQTVAALLRMQARRVSAPESRAALEEAVRRVGSIALVHETLSRSLDGVVEFDVIADQLLTSVGEVAASEAVVHRSRTGSFGALPAETATPLSMVLTELLQNALEHGLRRGGRLAVHAQRRDGHLDVEVSDDGEGLPAGFAVAQDARLGLRIVRTLIEGDLEGTLTLEPGEAGRGTVVRISVPLRTRR